MASEGHRYPKTLDVNEVCSPRPELNKFILYGETKLCLVLFTSKLASLLKGNRSQRKKQLVLFIKLCSYYFNN